MEEKNKKIFWVHIFNFFIALSYGTILYTGSTYLSSVFGASNIWMIYSLAAVSTILLNMSVTRLLRKFHIERLVRIAVSVSFVNFILLFTSTGNLNIALCFVIFMVLAEFQTMLASIMTEDLSRDSVTGGIRGMFISIQSLGYLLAPLVSSFVISAFTMKHIFIMSSVFIFSAFIILNYLVKKVPQISIHQKNTLDAYRHVWRNKDLRNIIIAQVGLATFYSLAVIYIPFKLGSLGIQLETYLKVILPFALIPFLFVPNILGHLEDKMRNEKEMLIFSYLGLIFSICLFAFVTYPSIILWGGLLFMSRIFASSCETSISSYLFKKIDKTDTATISLFSSAQSISFLIFTPIFSLLLKYSSLEILFLSVSFLLCFVLVLVSKIHDTSNYEKHQNWKKIWSKATKRHQKSSSFGG